MFVKILVLLGGVYLLVVNSILGIGFSWKAQRTMGLIGEKASRILFGILGVFLIACAIMSFAIPDLLTP